MSKYFVSSHRGEIQDLREKLNSSKDDVRTEAVKRIVAAMTEGKDVSMLFIDVLKCMQTNKLELKKLVYLYLMNYSRSQPERAILVVNSFVKDSTDTNPLIRALAIRTMGCIRVQTVFEYFLEPLTKCLKDSDPYVRKTAVLCVLKLYCMNPQLIEQRGFVETIKGMLLDDNQMVVSNVIAVLHEIGTSEGKEWIIDDKMVRPLLSALDGSNEWGQIYIMDALATYGPTDPKEAENICERVANKMTHNNPAVVMAAVKIVLRHLEVVSPQIAEMYCKRLAPPLVSIVLSNSSKHDYEIQYITLRCINLIVQKYPHLFSVQLRTFYCSYDEPIYIKLEKLEIMLMLVNETNVMDILVELKEYALSADIEFVRKAVQAFGRCALKLDKVADRCVKQLVELIELGQNYIVQEACIVMKDLFRKYPQKYLPVIAKLCDNLNTLDDPNAKAAMIWIIGEYNKLITNSSELLYDFMNTFADEPLNVQLALLTAAVKFFITNPEAQDLVQKALTEASNSQSFDLRDRAHIYWRILFNHPEEAKKIINEDRVVISSQTQYLHSTVLTHLMSHLGELSVVYQKVPAAFVVKLKKIGVSLKLDEEESGSEMSDLLCFDGGSSNLIGTTSKNVLDFDEDSGRKDGMSDVFAVGKEKIQLNRLTALPKTPTDMKVNASLIMEGGSLFLQMEINNNSPLTITNFQMQFNKNAFGLVPGQLNIDAIPPTKRWGALIPIGFITPEADCPVTNRLEVAIANSTQQIYFYILEMPVNLMFKELGKVDVGNCAKLWNSLPNTVTKEFKGTGVEDKLKKTQNMFLVANKKEKDGERLMYTFKFLNDLDVMLEVTTTSKGFKAVIKCVDKKYLPLVVRFLETLL
ncbi:AP-2 complex subunit beta-1, putative [Entamoeba invadens IP1]|uniref:AP complex subunit beta n=1 Tax=Entamoeba invadens IP1 TaxID=370355 RepID=A0A0A1UEK2_ENTIV|nr:AP-2 complex subunit beta-1, putative [Entamoeba invadens IP1]ELP94918.1 AP-2 complex subunit beta-1, putative [Entamoeba invadens IP1]|eukprot:XP_004261689.1 AP-2 complex subunit beta-1, putative [Entamoeba invadens IP1]